MERGPMVSVIMPAYNSQEFIKEAISSVQNQSYGNWELFVIDDASKDSTVEEIEKITVKDNRITLIKNTTNQGAGVARNKGIKAAAGKYIAFLDADDIWFPKKLSKQVRFMLTNNLGMSYGSYRLISENGTVFPKGIEALPSLTFQKLLKSNYVGNLTGMYDVEKAGKILGPELRKRQDWALWLSVLKKVGVAKGIKEPLAAYRVRKDAISGNKMSLLKYNFLIYKDFMGWDYLKSSVYMSRFLWEHFRVKNKQLKVLKEGGELF